MNWRRNLPLLAAVLLSTAVTLAGCGSRTKPVTPPAEPPAEQTPAEPPATPKPQLPPGPDLAQVKSPYDLSLDELAAGLLRYMNQSEGSPGARLDALMQQWNLRPPAGGALVIPADLNGDGITEWVTALNGQDTANRAIGTVFVIYRKDSGYAIDKSNPVVGAGLHAVTDITGEGPEIIWSSTDHGAHTTYSTVYLARWTPGEIQLLPGSPRINFMELAVEGKELALTGGLVGSAGAGEAQRPRTDRYRWVDGALQLVDRRYAPSEYGYHKLIDGIIAEQFGRTSDAEPLFRQVLEPGRTMLEPDWVPPEFQAPFADAVEALARFRLGAWLRVSGQPDEARTVLSAATGPFAELPRLMLEAEDHNFGCMAASDWGAIHPEFLEALNSPYGYANPQWTADSICGPLPPSD